MKQDEFTLALNALLPGCDPEAASKWAEFAIECVEQEQFAHFIPMEHDTAIEKWMDTTFAGLCAVKHEYGPEIATKVADLACQRCALYPGEMLVAAMILEGGGDAERIASMLAYGDIELEPDAPFFLDLPDGAALTRQGPEIGIAQSGVPCGLMEKRTEPGFLLADGTALLESERDDFGRYRGGAGMDGMYLQTGRLYAPVRGVDGQINSFQEVKPITGQEREKEFLSYAGDAAAVYRFGAGELADRSEPLERVRLAGGSPIMCGYNLISTGPIMQGVDVLSILNEYRANGFVRPGDVAAFKQSGTVTCWYVDYMAFSKLPNLLNNPLAAAEMSTEVNYNQIDGIINNEAPKSSLRDTLRQYQSEVRKQDAQPPGKHPEQER